MKADVTDIFVLLVYYVWKHDITTQVSMKKYKQSLTSVKQHQDLVASVSLLLLHASTGCDTVSYPIGKGKVSAVNLLLKSDVNLDTMRSTDTPEDIIMEIGSTVLLYLYGCTSR